MGTYADVLRKIANKLDKKEITDGEVAKKLMDLAYEFARFEGARKERDYIKKRKEARDKTLRDIPTDKKVPEPTPKPCEGKIVK